MADLKQLAPPHFHETLAAIDVPAVMIAICAAKRASCRWANSPRPCWRFSRCVVAIGQSRACDGRRPCWNFATDCTAPRVVCAPVAPAKPLSGLQYSLAASNTEAESWRAAQSFSRCFWHRRAHASFLSALRRRVSAVELPLDHCKLSMTCNNSYRALVTCGASIDEINTFASISPP